MDGGEGRRFLLCTAWSPWVPSRGFQHRLALVAETLGSLGTVDVCVLDRWRSPELELDWPDWVGDAEWCRVEQSRPDARGFRGRRRLPQQLVAAGEHVVDVPPKLSSREPVRKFTKMGRLAHGAADPPTVRLVADNHVQ